MPVSWTSEGAHRYLLYERALDLARAVIAGETVLSAALDDIWSWVEGTRATVVGGGVNVDEAHETLFDMLVNELAEGRHLPACWSDGLSDTLKTKALARVEQFAQAAWSVEDCRAFVVGEFKKHNVGATW